MATSKSVKSFDEFKKELETNQDLQRQFQENPINAVQQFQQQNPLQTDTWIYRIIVSALGLTVLTIIVGVIVLMFNGKISDDKTVPTIFTAIGSAAIGALAGLLAPSPRNPTT
jgi:hypothetical protein